MTKIGSTSSHYDKFKKNFWSGRRLVKAQKVLSDTFLKVENIDNSIGSKNVQTTRFLGAKTTEKMNAKPLGKLVTGLDKSLIETKNMQKLLGVELSTVAKESAEYTMKYTGSQGVKVATASVRTAKVLANIPLVGVILESLFEVPDVVAGFKNGDGISQVGRSSTKIAMGSLGMALASCLAKDIPVSGKFKGLIKFAATVAGSIVGSKAGKATGNLVFGESIKDQNAKVLA